MQSKITHLGNSFKQAFTAYDLFALTVVIMLFGHIGNFFYPDITALRVPDRVFVAVFLISAGYNTGYKISTHLIVGALILTGLTYILYRNIYIDILGVILLLRLTLNPIAYFITKNKIRFWLVCFSLLLISPFTSIHLEYGTLALIMALAGWINRNRVEVPESIVKTYQIYFFSYFAFLFNTIFFFPFSIAEFFIVCTGGGLIFWLLYDFRSLLINSIKKRPNDLVKKFCRFLGHKSLEIYVAHMIIFQFIILFGVI